MTRRQILVATGTTRVISPTRYDPPPARSPHGIHDRRKTHVADSERLFSELTSHRAALLAFIETAEGIQPDGWNISPAADKWSPAQVTEHLRMTYATLSGELAGQGGFRIRTTLWQRSLFRLRYLRTILRSGRFPAGVPATREIRPGPGPYDRHELLSALSRESEKFLAAVSSAPPSALLTHPFLGRLPLLDGVRFATQHIRHHHPQIVPG